MVTKHSEKPLLTTTGAKATAAIPERRFANYSAVVCGNAERAFGVFRDECSVGDAPGIICEGIALVETGAAFPKGAAITSDAQGRARAAVGTEPVNGYAVSESSGAGEFVPVHLK